MGDVNRRHGKFYIRWYDGTGKRKQQATDCKNVSEARELLRDREAEADKVRRGVLPAPVDATAEDKRRRTITVAELASRFLGDVEGAPGYAPPSIKSIAKYRQDARSTFKARILPVLSARAASTVTALDVEALRDSITARGLAAASVLQTLAVLSKLFAWGRKVGLLDCANPCVGIERPRPAMSLDFLAHVEVLQLIARVEAGAIVGVSSWQALALAPMVSTALLTGMRKGELFGLRWTDLDLDACRLTVARSYELLPKSDKPRHLTIHPDLARTLRRWRTLCPATPDGLVFPVESDTGRALASSKRQPSRLRMGRKFDLLGLDVAFAGAGLRLPADDHPWHELRHTFASHFVMAGGSLFSLQRILGHATPAMTQRYAHLAPDFLAGEVAKMSFAPVAPVGISDLDQERRRRAAEGAGS